MAEINQYAPKIPNSTVTILSGQTDSDAIALKGTTPVVVEMPATITGTSMTFKGSIDNGTTYCVINNSVGAISYTVAASGSYVLNPAQFVGYDHIKIVMASQGADRTLKIKPYAV